MSIPHVQRIVTDVDRTIVDRPMPEVFDLLLQDLPDILDAHEHVRLDAWPEAGLTAPGDSFWAVHDAAGPSHAVQYTVRELDAPTGLGLRSRSDLHVADHRVVLAPEGEGACEVVWSCRLDPDRALTQALLDDAALLGRTVLRRLTDRELERTGTRAAATAGSVL